MILGKDSSMYLTTISNQEIAFRTDLNCTTMFGWAPDILLFVYMPCKMGEEVAWFFKSHVHVHDSMHCKMFLCLFNSICFYLY